MVEAVTATAFATITTDTATRPPLWAVRELWLAARSRYVCDSHDNDDEYLNTLLIRMVNGKFNEFRILCAIIACDAPSSYRLWITLNFHSLSHVFSCVRTPALSKWAPFPNKNIQIAALLLIIYLFILPNWPTCIWNRAKPCDQFCFRFIFSSVFFRCEFRVEPF